MMVQHLQIASCTAIAIKLEQVGTFNDMLVLSQVPNWKIWVSLYHYILKKIYSGSTRLSVLFNDDKYIKFLCETHVIKKYVIIR